ncbi:MAG TPA: hypothetical protein VJB56_00090 [Candidatus Paceibacterota bacterium]
MFVQRSDENPILVPDSSHAWESQAAFNGCPVRKNKALYLLYRAVSDTHFHSAANTHLRVSTIGSAVSTDGIHFRKRRQLVTTDKEWERFGCEDPRVTKFDGTYYIFYTALSRYPFEADGIKVAVALSKNLEKIDEKHLVTPFNAKAMALFPRKIRGRIWALLTVHTDKPPSSVCLASFKNEKDIWSEAYWQSWYRQRDLYALSLQRSPVDHVECGAPPIETPYGWLVIHSYIRNYFAGNKLFGVEAVLLDFENPMNIIGRTDAPLLVPREEYEKYGEVPNIIFPSGALLEKGKVHIYYGAADTTCAVASVNLKDLISVMLPQEQRHSPFVRYEKNPIISPLRKHSWESRATFNPSAIYEKGKTHILYRAMSDDNTSSIGYASSKDGLQIVERSPKPVFSPTADFEQKRVPNGFSGCEDPRLTKIGGKIYMCYTAYNGTQPPRIALTSISSADFIRKRWHWKKPIIISPPNIDDKDACIFPEKVKGKYLIFHRLSNTIDYALVNDLEFKKGRWLEEHNWISPRPGMWDGEKVGAAAAPIRTKYGWVMFYHGVSQEDKKYRVGALLLSLKNPLQVIARSYFPLFEPEAEYEKVGQFSNVVFPCGAVMRRDTIYLYYGGGDSVVGVATIKLPDLIRELRGNRAS